MGKKKERVKKLFRDKELPDRGHYSKRRAAVILSVVSALTCILSVVGYLLIKVKFGDTNVLKEWVGEHPVLGTFVMLAVCCVQVVVAFIPGELVEVAAGYVFGTWWGTVICLLGALAGSVIAILLTRRFGRKLVESLYPKEKLNALPVLNDPSKRNAMTAILFLIPGTPKDFLTYIIGLTDMSIPLYILLTAFCRLPSIIMSTVSGHSLGENRIRHAVCFFVLSAVVSGCGYLIYLAIHKRQQRKKHDVKENQ